MTTTIATVMETTLPALAKEINVRLDKKGEGHRIAAGILLRQARALVPNGHWAEWCSASIKRSRGEIIRLMTEARPKPEAPSRDTISTMAATLYLQVQN